MMREIGSNFWDNKQTERTNLGFIEQEYSNCKKYYFKSGRNAIKAICQYLKKEEQDKNIVLLPMYTCSTVIEPFLNEGYNVQYFDINGNLEPSVSDLEKKIIDFKPSIILFHSYFGLNNCSNIYSILKEAQKKNIVVIEDITQSLFSTFKKFDADYYVGSLRKFICISDGGIVITKNELNVEIKSEADELVVLNEKASYLKKLYMEYKIDNKDEFRNYYVEMNKIFSKNDEIQKMSKNAKDTLLSIDIAFLKEKRRENYSFLQSNIINLSSKVESVLGNLKSGEVPLYFPVYLENREKRRKLQNQLAQANIYCPIIWPKFQLIDCTNSNAKKIYDRILCIPIDQRYSTDDMEYIIDKVKEVTDEL